MQIIPVKDSLLYVQPIYVISENGGQPTFGFVIVSYGGEAKFGATLEEALNQFPQFAGIAPAPPSSGGTTPPATGSSTVAQLLQQANAAYADAQKALAAKDLATYQAKIDEIGTILGQLSTAEASGAGTTTTTKPGSATSTTTSTTRPSSKPGAQALGR